MEMGRDLPEHPTLFAKYPEALIGPNDDIALPQESDAVDWEGELAVVIGKPARNAHRGARPRSAIAGYAVLNDVTMRDYQFRTLQWLQGKTLEKTTPFGPSLVTTDEWTPGRRCSAVDGETMQEVPTADLVFTPANLVSYISTIITLNPGDVIATGTPGGVGPRPQAPALPHRTGQILVTPSRAWAS